MRAASAMPIIAAIATSVGKTSLDFAIVGFAVFSEPASISGRPQGR
jgi:hypothetical protein